MKKRRRQEREIFTWGAKVRSILTECCPVKLSTDGGPLSLGPPRVWTMFMIRSRARLSANQSDRVSTSAQPRGTKKRERNERETREKRERNEKETRKKRKGNEKETKRKRKGNEKETKRKRKGNEKETKRKRWSTVTHAIDSREPVMVQVRSLRPALSGAIWILAPDSACSREICSPPRPMTAKQNKKNKTHNESRSSRNTIPLPLSFSGFQNKNYKWRVEFG